MRQRIKRFTGVILSLALILGLVSGMSLNVRADGTAFSGFKSIEISHMGRELMTRNRHQPPSLLLLVFFPG